MRELRLRHIEGNVTTTAKTATAWFVLEPQRWNWRSEAERDALIDGHAKAYSTLVEHWIHLRSTTVLSSPQAWRRRVKADAINPLPARDDHLDRVAARLQTLDLSEKITFLGVEIQRSASKWLGALWQNRVADDVERWVTASAFHARPALTSEIEWLIRRSVALGHPPPRTSGLEVPWEETDIQDLADTAEWNAVPYDRCITTVVPGRPARFVAVCSLSRQVILDSNSPWLSRTDSLGFPVEISAAIHVMPDEQTMHLVTKVLQKIRSQLSHYREMDADVPHNLGTARDRAHEVQQEVEAGFTDLNTRSENWFRIAAFGDTEAETQGHMDRIKSHYSPGVSVAIPGGKPHGPGSQYWLAREFIPGERRPITQANRRQMPVRTLAGAMPMVTANVGHSTGIYLGWTKGSGGRHAAFWHLHRSMEERERSGLTLVTGVPGSGKTSLCAQVVYQSTLDGVRWVVLDPTGGLAKLCALPEFAGVARHTDLMNATPGILNPYRIIPDPVRARFGSGEDMSEVKYDHAMVMAASQRRQLCADILQMFLPAALAEMASTQIVTRSAVRRSPATTQGDPREVIGALRSEPDLEYKSHAKQVASFLEDVAELPAAQLIFPTGDEGLDYTERDTDIRLEVVTLEGLVLPRPGIERKDYSSEETMADPLLQLAAQRCSQIMYHTEGRTGIDLDEVWHMTRVPSGRSLINTLGRRSRALNARVLLCSQEAASIMTADIGNLIDSSFTGRTENEADQVDALRIAKVPTGVGFEKNLGNLSPHMRGSVGRSGVREMLFNDGEGGIEKIVIDLGHLPSHVQQAIDSTPTKGEVLA